MPSYTLGPWKANYLGGQAWRIEAPAKNDLLVAVTITGEADARLVAEAPNMFALLQEYLKQHAFCAEEEPGEGCQCLDCAAARFLVKRVLEG